MKSASSTASCSGQQKERSIPDDESRIQVEDMSELGTGESTALPGAPPANTRWRIVVESEPVAVTTQEAVDGYCEKTMRIAVGHGSGAQVGRTIELLWRIVTTQSGLMELQESQPPDSCHALAREYSFHEGEEKGMRSAALRGLLRIVKDQIEDEACLSLCRTESQQSGETPV